MRRDGMILTAPRDVYAPTEALAAHALDLWSNRPPEPEFVDGALAKPHAMADVVASGAMVDLLQHGAKESPDLSFMRMLAIQHRWA